ncbi:MAG: hypothetical protein U0230_21005 [Polyangiales bacterium]
MRSRLLVSMVLPFFTLLGGCPVWGSTGGGGGGTSGCRTNGDCASATYCNPTTRKCDSSIVCATDAACPTGQVCDYRSTCVPQTPPQCRGNSDCTGSQLCIEGYCRDASTEVCQFNYECAGGRLCVNSTCVAQCTSDASCGSGQKCDTTAHYCVTDPTECTTSADCSSHRHCVQGRCLQDCTGSSSCSNSVDACQTSNSDYFCRPEWNPRAFCSNNTQCTSPSVCDLTDHVCRIPCTYNAGSNADDVFCMQNDAQLVSCGSDGYCHTQHELSPTCATQSNCASGQSCVDGICQ